MSGSKHFDKIAWVVTALMLVVTILFMNGASLGMEVMNRGIGYEEKLFDNSKVHSIDIVMNNWDEFIANATSEEYYVANLVIDGEAYKNVGIRGKGNTSLSTVASLGSERYSFKVEFDQYDNSITYHGLDKLSLNNLIQDSTMMKDYLAYTMMNEFDATAPLCSFVYITVNGEDWGLYLAVEGVEDAFLERNYGSDYGELYKPDSMSFGGGRGNGRDFDMNEFEFDSSDAPEREMLDASSSATMPEGFDPSDMFGGRGDRETSGKDSSKERSRGGFGGFGMGSSDVKLQYIDDNLDSYSNIWNNAKTDITQADQKRLIDSLKKLSVGEEIESVVDVEKVIRYFVVHNYICNDDSYTGMMVHNYYLYEENGQLAMIPWDYNLGYGTFSGSGGNSTVNTPIDMPVTGGSSDRPMLNWIFENDEYTQMYHQYFEEFINTVDIQALIEQAYQLIKPYVEKDPTAFYSYEEFEKGVETMKQFCALRSESITMQLETGETTSNMGYVDGSGITLSDMGSMGGRGGFGGGMPNRPDRDSTEMPEGFDPSQMPGGFGGGEMPEGFDPSQMPGGFVGGEMPEGFDPSQMPGGFGGDETTEASKRSDSTSGNRSSRENMQKPEGMGDFSMPDKNVATSGGNGGMLILVSGLVLAVGLLIAKKYKY